MQIIFYKFHVKTVQMSVKICILSGFYHIFLKKSQQKTIADTTKFWYNVGKDGGFYAGATAQKSS